MKEITLLRRGSKRCAYQLRNLLSKATKANYVVVSDLNSIFLEEYDEQLKERREDTSIYMPRLGTLEEGYPFEDQSLRGVHYPRWLAPDQGCADSTGARYYYPIDGPKRGVNHTFDELESQFSMLKAWELLLVWRFELRIRSYRESIRGFEEVIGELQIRAEEPLDTDISDIDYVFTADLISK